MTRPKIALAAAFVSVAFTSGTLALVSRQRAREASALRFDNGRMLLDFATRAREVPTPPGAENKVPASVARNRNIAPDNPQSAPRVEIGRIYRNEGSTTPLATMQTFAWACDVGDTATLTRLICFDGNARAKGEAIMATMPVSVRSQWRSLEEMAAMLLAAANIESPFPDADILSRATTTTLSEDHVMLRLPGTLKDRMQYQRTSDGWKFVVTETLVDALARKIADDEAAVR